MNKGISGMGMKKMRRVFGDVGVDRRGLQIRAIEDNRKRQQERDIKSRRLMVNPLFNSVKDLFGK